MAVAGPLSGSIAIHYVLSVLWMTSRFTFGHNVLYGGHYDNGEECDVYECLVCVSYYVFFVGIFHLCCCLGVSTSAIDCLERLIFEMTYYVSSGMLNHIYSLTV